MSPAFRPCRSLRSLAFVLECTAQEPTSPRDTVLEGCIPSTRTPPDPLAAPYVAVSCFVFAFSQPIVAWIENRRSVSARAIAAISASSVAPSRGPGVITGASATRGRRCLIRSTKGELGTPSKFRKPEERMGEELEGRE